MASNRGKSSYRTRHALAWGIFIAVAVFGWGSGHGQPAGPPAVVVKAKRACFASSVRFTGLVVPKAEAIVNLPDNYQISEVSVKEGQTVKEGDTLAKLTRLSNAASDSGPGQNSGAASQSQQPASMLLPSPVRGVVSKSTAKVGAVASPMPLPPPMGPEPLFRIIVENVLEIAAEVPSADLPKVKSKDLADIQLDNGHETQGQVRTILPEIDSKTQLGKVRITLGPDPAIRNGMFSRGVIVKKDHSCGISVPRDAVQYEGATVQVVKGTTVETHRVRLGQMSDDAVEVLDGINEGDLVIANAGASLHNGDQVKPELASDQEERQ